MEHQIQFPRDAAPALRHRLATTGSWKLLAEQEQEGSILAAPHRRSSELVRAVPSEEHLREILDVAYAASLMEDEGRRIHSTIGYLNEEGAQALGFGVVPFSQPLELGPSTLSKVALCGSPSRTTLGVWPAKSGELQIWGLIHHGDQTFAIDLEHKPTYLSLRILRPGTFTVHFDARLVLLFSRDHFYLFENRLDLLGTLRDRAGIKPVIARDLCRLARRVLALGHGGTILVIDKDAPPVGLKWHPSFTPPTGNALLGDALALDERGSSGELRTKEMSDAQSVRRHMEVEAQHDEALDFIAQLTAIDGAIVIRDDLFLVGFGVTIGTGGMPKHVMLEDPRNPGKESQVALENLGGNRHRSAVCFCAQQKSLALALVASQDGDLSLVARRKNDLEGPLVQVIRPFELGVGI